MKTGLRFVRPDWPAPARVRALVSERVGGVSTGVYATLNLGARSGDDEAAVAENRRRLRQAAVLPAEPVWLRQVHGADVVELDAHSATWAQSPVSAETAEPGAAEKASIRFLVPGRDAEDSEQSEPIRFDPDFSMPARDDGFRPSRTERVQFDPDFSEDDAGIEADAAVTRTPGVVCAVLTADCLPVFVAARDGTCVGVAHAGWRGLAAGVIERAVERIGLAPDALVAWLGPAIGPAAFEVGDDVVAAFRSAGFATDAAITPNTAGRWQADLYALARQSLARAGVSEVRGGGFCTYTEFERFFSHRRDGLCGRLASLIWID